MQGGKLKIPIPFGHGVFGVSPGDGEGHVPFEPVELVAECVWGWGRNSNTTPLKGAGQAGIEVTKEGKNKNEKRKE